MVVVFPKTPISFSLFLFSLAIAPHSTPARLSRFFKGIQHGFLSFAVKTAPPPHLLFVALIPSSSRFFLFPTADFFPLFEIIFTQLFTRNLTPLLPHYFSLWLPFLLPLFGLWA